MNLIRTITCILALALLVGGYCASQWAVWNGTTADFAQKIDSPAIKSLAAVVVLAAIAIHFTQAPEVDPA